MRILIVDDERDLSSALVELLCEEGYRAHAAHDLEVADRELEALNPDVVLVDYLVGAEDAGGWIAAIRDRVRVVLMSAAPAARAHAAMHDVAFVPKPFDISDLLQALLGDGAR
jgi:DNA-binding response OmpR family regulator